MTEDPRNRFLWLVTWVFVAVSSAGYAIVNLISSASGGAGGTPGFLRFLVEVALPIGMCTFAIWLGLEEWRGSKRPG